MRLRQPPEEAVLTGEEIATVRQVLCDCSAVLTAVQEMPGAALGEVTRAMTAGKRSPGGLIYYVNLAIDYLDFAPAARSRR
jgi:hypothetical protein